MRRVQIGTSRTEFPPTMARIFVILTLFTALCSVSHCTSRDKCEKAFSLALRRYGQYAAVARASPACRRLAEPILRKRRENWVKRTSDRYYDTYQKKYNVMVIYSKVPHEVVKYGPYKVTGLKVNTETYVLKFSGRRWSYNYFVYVFKSGRIVNNGDGGYINWAFRGRWRRSGRAKKVVDFFQI